MQALIEAQEGEKTFALAEINEREPKAREVKVKVKYAGICGTDLHAYAGHFDISDLAGVMGHEFSGFIESCGKEVTDWQPGQRVTAEHTYKTCECCDFCQQGEYHLCSHRQSVGFEKQGAFAEYVYVNPDYLHLVPEEVSLKDAALTEPLASILHALEYTNLKPFNKVLIIGPGPMGLLAGKTIKNYNCQLDIIGAKGDEKRLQVAENNGLQVISQVQPEKYDLVFECSGSAGGINTALDAVKRKGQLIQVGMNPEPIEVVFEKIAYKELQINGVFCHRWANWENALNMLAAKQIFVSDLVTSLLDIKDWERGFESLLAKEEIKVLLEF